MLFEKTNAKQVGLLIRSRLIDRRSLLVVAAILMTVFGTVLAVRSAYAETSNASKTGKHVLTVHDGGNIQGVLTEADTLREALAAAEIEIGEHDVTEPALDETLVAASYDVNIYRARPVAVYDEGTLTKVMTPHHSAQQIAKQAGVELQDEDDARLESSPDVVSDGAIERLVIDRSTKFTLIFYGKKTTEYTRASTVAELLTEKGIILNDTDRISPKTSAKIEPGMTVDVWREGKQTVTREEVAKFSVRQIQDADRDVGYRKVETPGQNGKKLVTYVIVVKNGKEVSKKAVKTVVTEEPKEQVEIVGAKSPFEGDLAGAFAALRQCESGGNYANKNNPLYRGAYQFSYSTWANNGGYYDPADAPPAVQDKAALDLYNRRGWQPWPSCSQSLGLR